MRRAIPLLLCVACAPGASSSDGGAPDDGGAPFDGGGGCLGPPAVAPSPPIDYRAEMIAFVTRLGAYARCRVPGFSVFPQNAAELGADPDYVTAVDGIGQEDIYYGYDGDGIATPAGVTADMEFDLDRFTLRGKLVLTIDYPFDDPAVPSYDSATLARISDAFTRSRNQGYVPAVQVRDLSALVVVPGFEPPPNDAPVASLDGVENWGYRLQPASGQSRSEYLAELASVPFDLLVTDYSTDGTDGEALSPFEVDTIRAGTRGFLVAYMSIGEAEDYRSYWDPAWASTPPSFLAGENPDWPGNHKVRYWDPQWQALIYGSPGAYLDKILAAGFDGTYLDIIDAYECFETGACAP